jgi:tetratricopeptide (TPR) repeat protein
MPKKNKGANNSAIASKPSPYHLTSAKWQSMQLRDLVVVKLARAIEERAFSQRQAADYLGVSQPRISDLLRGNSHLFSLDTLIEWMFALDKPVVISFSAEKGWGRSNPQAWSQEDLRDKIAFYNNVIKYNPDNSTAYSRRGMAYTDLEEYEMAIQDYSKCVDLAPERVGSWSNLAGAYKRAQQYEKMLHNCNELIRRFPEDGSGYYQRADAYSGLKEFDKALADYAKMIEIDPMRPGPYINRANVYLQMNRPKDALADFEKAVEKDPTYDSAHKRIEELKKQISLG